MTHSICQLVILIECGNNMTQIITDLIMKLSENTMRIILSFQ